MKHEEYQIAVKLTQWLQKQHKTIIFRYDIADIKLTLQQAVRLKKMQGGTKSYPDLFIAETREDFGGCYIELKKDVDEVYTKKNEMRNNEHIKAQNEMLIQLRQRGYYAEFGLGFEDAKNKINDYLKLKVK